MTDTLPAFSDLSVFMRGLELEAEIGVYPHERGRAQRLVIDVEVTLKPARVGVLGDTLNYEVLASDARRLVAEGHVDLVETFAQRLASACLAHEQVLKARIRVEKPGALPGAAAAGVEIVAVRD